MTGAAEEASVGPPPPWADLARGGWHPTVEDVRAGYADRGPGRARPPLVPGSRRAAVLLILFPEDGRAHLVMIERSRHSGTHRGDIAFPGGVLQPRESPRTAALRETAEEIGVPPDDVEVIADLDDVATWTGFVIRPYVAIAARRPSFTANPDEVERVISLPLADLLVDGAHRRVHSANGAQWSSFRVPGGLAWGLTGDLVHDVLATAAAGQRRSAG